jgi:tetratricopeptide (TPR) repeat protein
MKKFALIVCLLALALGIGLYGVDKADDQVAKNAKRAYEKGIELAKRQQWDKAAEMFNEAIKLEPEWGPPYASLAAMKRLQNKFEEARQDYEKALNLRPELIKSIAPEYAVTLINLGSQAMNDQEPEKSKEYFLKILDIPSMEAYDKKLYLNAVYLVGNVFTQMSQFEKAASYFLKLIQMTENQPEFSEFYANGNYMAGINLSQMKKYEEASPYLLKYIDLNKGNANAAQFVVRADYMLGINNYELLNLKSEQIMAEPLSAERKAKMDRLQQDKDKLSASPVAGSAQKIAEIEDEMTLIRNDDIKEKREKIAKAAQETEVEAFLASVIQNIPDLEDTYVRLGNYYYLCQNYEKAIEFYKKLIEKFPSSQDISSYKKFLDLLEKESVAVKK